MDLSELLRPEVLVFVVGGLVAIVCSLSWSIAYVLTGRDETRLKLRMIEQGYSAEEIERVVNASASNEAAGSAGDEDA